MTTGKKFSLIVGDVADNNKGAPCPPDSECPACGLKSFDRPEGPPKLCCHEISEASRAPFFFFSQRAKDILNPPTIKP